MHIERCIGAHIWEKDGRASVTFFVSFLARRTWSGPWAHTRVALPLSLVFLFWLKLSNLSLQSRVGHRQHRSPEARLRLESPHLACEGMLRNRETCEITRVFHQHMDFTRFYQSRHFSDPNKNLAIPKNPLESNHFQWSDDAMMDRRHKRWISSWRRWMEPTSTRLVCLGDNTTEHDRLKICMYIYSHPM